MAGIFETSVILVLAGMACTKVRWRVFLHHEACPSSSIAFLSSSSSSSSSLFPPTNGGTQAMLMLVQCKYRIVELSKADQKDYPDATQTVRPCHHLDLSQTKILNNFSHFARFNPQLPAAWPELSDWAIDSAAWPGLSDWAIDAARVNLGWCLRPCPASGLLPCCHYLKC